MNQNKIAENNIYHIRNNTTNYKPSEDAAADQKKLIAVLESKGYKKLNTKHRSAANAKTQDKRPVSSGKYATNVQFHDMVRQELFTRNLGPFFKTTESMMKNIEKDINSVITDMSSLVSKDGVDDMQMFNDLVDAYKEVKEATSSSNRNYYLLLILLLIVAIGAVLKFGNIV